MCIKEHIICKGISVNRGIVIGKVRKLDSSHQGNIEKYAILIIPNSDPIYAVELMSAKGVIIEKGSRLAHLCIVALEMGIPCLTQVEGAMKSLYDGQIIKLDADSGYVYEL